MRLSVHEVRVHQRGEQHPQQEFVLKPIAGRVFEKRRRILRRTEIRQILLREPQYFLIDAVWSQTFHPLLHLLGLLKPGMVSVDDLHQRRIRASGKSTAKSRVRHSLRWSIFTDSPRIVAALEVFLKLWVELPYVVPEPGEPRHFASAKLRTVLPRCLSGALQVRN